MTAQQENPKKDDPLTGQIIDNRYRLNRCIGTGGMSVVYLADRIGINKPIAIKFLRSAFVSLPDFVHRFEQEARACSRLNHLNCVSVTDFGVAFGSPYLVMEYVDGRLLSDLLNAGPFSVQRSLNIARQILSGLRHAHSREVIHRDLKPSNIMLAEMTGTQDFVKIMDFGTAQILSADASGIRRLPATDVGTPYYMSPEQASGKPTDPRTDLYSLGIILFQMLSGQRPFVAEDSMRVLQMHISSPIPSLRLLSPDGNFSMELEALINKALQKNPEDRFASAADFEQALSQLPDVTQPRISPPTPSRPVEFIQADIATGHVRRSSESMLDIIRQKLDDLLSIIRR